MQDSSFYTLKGYQLLEHKKITYAMEDYLEMICRIQSTEELIRVSTLAKRLNVRASSASKMIQNLRELSLVDFKKYGYIKPTEEGNAIGEYLIERHDILNRFLCYVNKTEDETEQAEKIEHYLDKRTIHNIEVMLCKQKA